MNPRPMLSVIVPVYNEAQRLHAPVSEVMDFLKSNFAKHEIIYSNDGSADGTAEGVQELSKTYPSIRLIGYERNRGKGAAVRAGFEAAKGDVLLFSDADFSSPIQESLK